MPSIKFPYKKLPASPIETHPKRRNILRPVIPVYLINGGNRVGYEVLVDSGADYCIFHGEIGEIIDIDVKSGPKMEFYGTGGIKQIAYFHNLIIEVGGFKYPCYTGFSYDIRDLPYGIVGQDEFFNFFVVIFDKEKARLV